MTEARRDCPFCEERKAVPYTDLGLEGAWKCDLCGYIWRRKRAATVESISRSRTEYRGAVDKVWFYMAGRKVGLKLIDASNITRYWIHDWLMCRVKDPSELRWDGMRGESTYE